MPPRLRRKYRCDAALAHHLDEATFVEEYRRRKRLFLLRIRGQIDFGIFLPIGADKYAIDYPIRRQLAKQHSLCIPKMLPRLYLGHGANLPNSFAHRCDRR